MLTPTRYFRLSLLLPLVLPVLAWGVGQGRGASVLILSLLGFGLPYAVFAAVLAVALGRVRPTAGVPWPVAWAPVLFLPVAAVAWLAFAGGQSPAPASAVGRLMAFLPMAALVLVLGYLQVGLSLLGWVAGRRLGWIAEVPKPTPSAATTSAHTSAPTPLTSPLHSTPPAPARTAP